MEEKVDSVPEYPACILPQPIYLDFINEYELWSEVNRLIIQRRCPNEYKGSGITPEIFGNNLAEMSVNLLGGKFSPDFVVFTPKGVKPMSSGIPFEGNYTFDQDARGSYLFIASIHDKTFPSWRKFPNQQEYEKIHSAIEEESEKNIVDDARVSDKKRLLKAFSKVKGFSKETEYQVKYCISVMHRPTNANYWHCQIEIAPASEDGKTVSKDKAEWQKDALRALTNFLVGYAFLALPDPIPPVKEDWYVKSA